MKQEKLLQDLGTSATFFGLGLLAAKKLRPYAKFFILGGMAASAVPGVLAAVEQIKSKRAESQPVEEVVIEEPCSCCEDEAPCADEVADEADECCCQEQTAEAAAPVTEQPEESA